MVTINKSTNEDAFRNASILTIVRSSNLIRSGNYEKNYVVLFSRHVHQPADEKMIAEAEQRGLPVEINAYGVAEFAEQVGHYQVVLLGPQVKYMQQDLQKQADKYGIRVEPINMMDYGMQKGAAVLDFALSLIENKN